MAQAKSVTFHRRAAMALDAFSERDKARIENAARQLVSPDSEAQLRSKTAKIATPEPMYVMRAAPAIRLIYRETTEGVEILDVVKKATLRTFLDQAEKPTAAGSSRSAKAIPPDRAKNANPPLKKPLGTA